MEKGAAGGHGACLIILTALKFGSGYGTAALRAAAERACRVVLCLVVDRDISEAVSGQLVDVGFLGEKVMESLREAMITEYRTRGREYLDSLVAEARALGLDVETVVKEGPFLESILEVCRERDISRIAVARGRRPHLSRVFFGSEIGRLEKAAPCPVDVFTWDGEHVVTRPPAAPPESANGE